MTTIDLKAINKGYGSTCIIATISRTFGHGLHLIEGPNGVGKTTLLEVIAGLAPPTSGAVLLDGDDLARRRRTTLHRLAYCPAQATFLDRVTVDAAVRLHLALRGDNPGSDPLHAFDPFSLKAERNTVFANLSLGWQKRVVLHMAFAARAAVLVLDEPTVGLDAPSVGVLRELMAERAAGQVTIFTCHDPSLLGLHHIHRYTMDGGAGGSVLSEPAPAHS